MPRIGFSTGSLALGNYIKALRMMENSSSNAIELSALREEELNPLLKALPSLELKKYSYCSFHAPGKLSHFSEKKLVEQLLKIAENKCYIILHPDIISDFSLWRKFDSWLCIENMDKRKSTGRTAEELMWIFDQLPEASFCFDIGHARQVDPTMLEANLILNQFKNRIKQLHVSEVNSNSIHEPLSLQGIWVYYEFLMQLNNKNEIPIILETPVLSEDLNKEIEKVEWIMGLKPLPTAKETT